MSGFAGWALLVVAVFAAVHVLGPSMRFLGGVPRSAWLSAAGGVSVAYVFVHLLPELAVHQDTLASERLVYLVALAGLALFYGLERMVKSRPKGSTFTVHLASYAVYNMLIGYLLVHREEQDPRGLAIYAVAMSLHFVVNDHGLRADHGELYDRQGRWWLAAAPVAGWLIGVATRLPAEATAALFAFLAGGIVLNVLKEELPEDRQSRFWAFAAGAAGYATLLLLV